MGDNTLNILISANADGVKKGADEAKEHLDSAAASVGILGDLVGISVPEALQKALAGVEGLGTALNAAFVPLQVISFLEEIDELRNKVSEAAHGLSQSWIEVSNTVERFHQDSEIALLQLAQRLDALKGNHLAQLKDKLREIDAQSMRNLGAQFDQIGKKADEFFRSMEVGWFQSLFVGKRFQDAIKDDHQGFGLLMNDIKNMEQVGEFKGIEAALDRQIARIKYLADQQMKFKSASTAEGLEIAQARLREVEILQSLKAAYEDIAKLNKGEKEESQRGFAQLATANRQVVDLTSNVHRASTILQELDRQSKAQNSAEIASQAALENLNNTLAQQVKKNFAEQYQEAASYYQGLIELARGEAQVTEANAARDLAQGKITKQQEIQIVAGSKVKELDLEIQYYRTLENFSATTAKERMQLENKITKDLQQQVVIRAHAAKSAAQADESRWTKQLQDWQNFNKQMQDSYLQMLNGMNSALVNFVTTGKLNWQQMATSMISDIVKIALQWVESQITMKIMGTTTQEATANASIAASASSGAAAAGASVAAIPVIGWSMVSEVATATYGILSAYRAGIAKFELGGIVPMTGLALVHAGETILPARMSGTGNFAGSSASPHSVNFNINALDGASVEAVYPKIRSMLMRDMQRAMKRSKLA